MSFRKKIDSILKDNTLGITSVSSLEDYLKCGRGAIQNFYKRDEYPGNITIRKIKSLDNLNKSWWESGLGSAFEATLSTVGEPELKSYADELINTLRLTNDQDKRTGRGYGSND